MASRELLQNDRRVAAEDALIASERVDSKFRQTIISACSCAVGAARDQAYRDAVGCQEK